MGDHKPEKHTCRMQEMPSMSEDATLVPNGEAGSSPFGWLRGMVTIHGDIVGSTGEVWEADE